MTEAVVAFSEWVFKNFPEVLRLEAGVYGLNKGSAKVLEKAGYTYEGTRRKAAYKNGMVMDILMYAMLRDES